MSTVDRSAGVQFIVTTDFTKADPKTRKFIRSHVMQGKNKVKSRPAKPSEPAKQAMMVDPSQSPHLVALDTLAETCYSFIPRRVGSDFSFTQFANEISPAQFGDMKHFFSNVMKYMFPLGEFIGFDGHDKTVFELLASDASFLHVTAFSAGAFIDIALRQQDHVNNQETILHFLKGVRLLREKLLRRDEEKYSDATVSVVLTLANCAYGTGDYETGRRHLEGLYKIVKLRGGLTTFKGHFGKKLLMEMFRCDIGIALHTNSAPIVFGDPALEPFVPYPDQRLWVIGNSPHNADSEDFLSCINEDLAAAWLALQKFCSLVSLAMETQRMFSMEIVLDTMASVMYRLLHMDFETGSTDEAIRLGLLALCYCIFLQWQGMKLPSSYFPSTFRSSIFDFKDRNGFPKQVLLWLLMVGAISIFSISADTWLKDCLQEHISVCHIRSWNELREALKSFIWISPLHDKLGEAIFDSVLEM
ncbi:hypothetical protein N431DRAFT_419622 [Stipitochalara longipes BDJ]|nr:hypothetical protein N431DRAFT_419622 [Stipitochalara longipes BDJ]